MIGMRIGGIMNLIALLRVSQSQGLTRWLLISGLVLGLSVNSVSAKGAIIESIYFNTDHSVVIETKDKAGVEFTSEQVSDGVHHIRIADSRLSRNVTSKLSNKDFEIELNKRNGGVELALRPKSGTSGTVTPKTILDGLAYELEFNALTETIAPWQAVSEQHCANGDDMQFHDSLADDLVANLPKPAQIKLETEDLHLLSAEASDHKVYTITQTKSEIDKFIEGLDDSLAAVIEADIKFQEETFHKIDSASLTHLADTLAEKGHSEEALAAYRRALELNAENINAKLGLAETTQDETEKLTNYLASVSDKALLEIGSHWFEQGYQAHDLKSVAKALVSFQFAVLKNPKNPEYRYRYAQVLERSGADFWSQATKRYLEAAALAKLEYLAGNKTIEPLLRGSTESLIRVLSVQGDFDNAAKYCAAYMNLGFKKFIDGKPVLAVLKEVEANRNPFAQELTQGIINTKELES